MYCIQFLDILELKRQLPDGSHFLDGGRETKNKKKGSNENPQKKLGE